jgi:NAD-dependent dihydropyrimidine dehydrogenase PreA subunit
MKCVKTCRTLSLKIETIKEKKGQPLITCTRCGECMTVCPQGAIDYSYVLCKHNPGLGKKLYERLNRKKGLIAKILKPVVLTVHEVLSARAMFMFSGYFFGMVFLSSFGTGTLHRFLNLFINGSFLLT